MRTFQFIPKQPEESVFGGVGLGQNFGSSLAPCSRTMSLAPDSKICASSLPNSQFFKLFRYISCFSMAFILVLGKNEAIAENKRADPLEGFLPQGLVMKSSPLPTRDAFGRLSDNDFHIAMHESHTAIIWVAEDALSKSDFLCGAICPISEDCLEGKFQSVINSKDRLITKWVASPRKGDIDIVSSIPHRKIDWETVDETSENEKWVISGIHKKQGAVQKYLIKKGDRSFWVSKEEALDLSLAGKLEIVIPQESD